jgi:hypothetical protein
MLTLDSALRIPPHVLFRLVEQDAVLLNTQTNKYYALDEVGARLYGLLKDGKGLRESYQVLASEYEVAAARLEGDLLELLGHLLENGLVEIIQG